MKDYNVSTLLMRHGEIRGVWERERGSLFSLWSQGVGNLAYKVGCRLETPARGDRDASFCPGCHSSTV